MSLENSLETWIIWCRDEQAMTRLMTVSYMPEASDDYRRGYADGLRIAESRLGLLMLEQGIDLRDVGKSENRNEAVEKKPEVKAEDSTTHTAEGKDISVEVSASKEPGDKPVDKTDQWGAETKRLSLERQKDAGIYDGEDAVRSIAMTLPAICEQLRLLVQAVKQASLVKDI